MMTVRERVEHLLKWVNTCDVSYGGLGIARVVQTELRAILAAPAAPPETKPRPRPCSWCSTTASLLFHHWFGALFCDDCWQRHPSNVVAAPGAGEAQPEKQENTMEDMDVLDPLKNPPVGGVFHWRDGFTFQRTQRGSVLMRTPHGLHVIPAHEWASIVAFVSRAGETGETFDAARAFHGA